MKLVITEPAKKVLADLDKPARKKIGQTLNKFLENPKNVNLKKLKGKVDQWRIAVDKWRIIFKLSSKTIYILNILQRKNAYRKF